MKTKKLYTDEKYNVVAVRAKLSVEVEQKKRLGAWGRRVLVLDGATLYAYKIKGEGGSVGGWSVGGAEVHVGKSNDEGRHLLVISRPPVYKLTFSFTTTYEQARMIQALSSSGATVTGLDAIMLLKNLRKKQEQEEEEKEEERKRKTLEEGLIVETLPHPDDLLLGGGGGNQKEKEEEEDVVDEGKLQEETEEKEENEIVPDKEEEENENGERTKEKEEDEKPEVEEEEEEEKEKEEEEELEEISQAIYKTFDDSRSFPVAYQFAENKGKVEKEEEQPNPSSSQHAPTTPANLTSGSSGSCEEPKKTEGEATNGTQERVNPLPKPPRATPQVGRPAEHTNNTANTPVTPYAAATPPRRISTDGGDSEEVLVKEASEKRPVRGRSEEVSVKEGCEEVLSGVPALNPDRESDGKLIEAKNDFLAREVREKEDEEEEDKEEEEETSGFYSVNTDSETLDPTEGKTVPGDAPSGNLKEDKEAEYQEDETEDLISKMRLDRGLSLDTDALGSAPGSELPSPSEEAALDSPTSSSSFSPTPGHGKALDSGLYHGAPADNRKIWQGDLLSDSEEQFEQLYKELSNTTVASEQQEPPQETPKEKETPQEAPKEKETPLAENGRDTTEKENTTVIPEKTGDSPSADVQEPQKTELKRMNSIIKKRDRDSPHNNSMKKVQFDPHVKSIDLPSDPPVKEKVQTGVTQLKEKQNVSPQTTNKDSTLTKKESQTITKKTEEAKTKRTSTPSSPTRKKPQVATQERKKTKEVTTTDTQTKKRGGLTSLFTGQRKTEKTENKTKTERTDKKEKTGKNETTENGGMANTEKSQKINKVEQTKDTEKVENAKKTDSTAKALPTTTTTTTTTATKEVNNNTKDSKQRSEGGSGGSGARSAAPVKKQPTVDLQAPIVISGQVEIGGSITGKLNSRRVEVRDGHLLAFISRASTPSSRLSLSGLSVTPVLGGAGGGGGGGASFILSRASRCMMVLKLSTREEMMEWIHTLSDEVLRVTPEEQLKGITLYPSPQRQKQAEEEQEEEKEEKEEKIEKKEDVANETSQNNEKKEEEDETVEEKDKEQQVNEEKSQTTESTQHASPPSDIHRKRDITENGHFMADQANLLPEPKHDTKDEIKSSSFLENLNKFKERQKMETQVKPETTGRKGGDVNKNGDKESGNLKVHKTSEKVTALIKRAEESSGKEKAQKSMSAPRKSKEEGDTSHPPLRRLSGHGKPPAGEDVVDNYLLVNILPEKDISTTTTTSTTTTKPHDRTTSTTTTTTKPQQHSPTTRKPHSHHTPSTQPAPHRHANCFRASDPLSAFSRSMSASQTSLPQDEGKRTHPGGLRRSESDIHLNTKSGERAGPMLSRQGAVKVKKTAAGKRRSDTGALTSRILAPKEVEIIEKGVSEKGVSVIEAEGGDEGAEKDSWNHRASEKGAFSPPSFLLPEKEDSDEGPESRITWSVAATREKFELLCSVSGENKTGKLTTKTPISRRRSLRGTQKRRRTQDAAMTPRRHGTVRRSIRSTDQHPSTTTTTQGHHDDQDDQKSTPQRQEPHPTQTAVKEATKAYEGSITTSTTTNYAEGEDQDDHIPQKEKLTAKKSPLTKTQNVLYDSTDTTTTTTIEERGARELPSSSTTTPPRDHDVVICWRGPYIAQESEQAVLNNISNAFLAKRRLLTKEVATARIQDRLRLLEERLWELQTRLATVEQVEGGDRRSLERAMRSVEEEVTHLNTRLALVQKEADQAREKLSSALATGLSQWAERPASFTPRTGLTRRGKADRKSRKEEEEEEEECEDESVA